MRYSINKCFRFDESTVNTLKKLTEGSNLSESEYIRELINRRAQEEYGVPRELFLIMSKDIAECGNKLSKINKHLDMNAFTTDDAISLKECLEDIRAIRSNLHGLY